jgi:RNA recognition motif-containing protein
LILAWFLEFSLICVILLLSEHKLFVGMLPKNVTHAEMTDLFSKYGNIKDLQILRGSQQTSKGKITLVQIRNGASP